jgi:hypothetical protein
LLGRASAFGRVGRRLLACDVCLDRGEVVTAGREVRFLECDEGAQPGEETLETCNGPSHAAGSGSPSGAGSTKRALDPANPLAPIFESLGLVDARHEASEDSEIELRQKRAPIRRLVDGIIVMPNGEGAPFEDPHLGSA